MDISEMLKKGRREQGLTQAEAADILGVTRQAVSNWERGENIPDLEMLKKIAKLYHVRLEVLIGEEQTSDISVRGDDMAEKEESVEKKYLSYFIVVAFLSISCIFPILGIFACILTVYTAWKLNLKSPVILVFAVIALLFSLWNSWIFINVNFLHTGTAVIETVGSSSCFL